MTQSKISLLLKAVIIGFCICVLLFYGFFIPMVGSEFLSYYETFSDYFLPWLIYLSVTAIPIFIAVYFAWKVVNNIGKDKSFCIENANAFKTIGILATIDTIYFFTGQIVLFFAGLNHPSIFIGSIIISFIGFAVIIVCLSLSVLIKKAALLQDDSDLTI